VRTGPLLAALAAALLVGVPASGAKQPRDYAAIALNVLAPGQSGSVSFPPNATDQAKLYDDLTALFDGVNASNYTRYFKSEAFGLGGAKPAKVERPRTDVTIQRDRWGVPHVHGKTRTDVEFGAGYASAEDRILLMQLLRGPGRLAALDVPGVNAFSVALTAQQFDPSPVADAELNKQVVLLERTKLGRQVIKDVDAYIAGINAYIKSAGDYYPHWTRTDVIGVAALIGAYFGVGGGDEARRSELLSALQAKLGTSKGRAVWNDLRSEQDPEAPVSIPGTFSAHGNAGDGSGNVVVDDGSLKAGALAAPQHMSNELLVGAKRSKTGHPLAVMGPQVGYAFPELLTELDLHGGGIDARGASFPGISMYVLLGRGKDFAWSATSANSDIVDQFVETLCGGDDTHYVYKGECRAMGTFDAGLLHGRSGAPNRELTFRTTVHGPVVGYATVNGAKVAISSDRSTRGRELLNAIPFEQLNANAVRDARSFIKTMSAFELTFNWFYVDAKHIAMFSSGRVPLRSSGVDDGLPTIGDGNHEWRGFVAAKDHPQAVDPKDGTIVNWNNKPALGWPASDDNWAFQSHQRVELLKRNLSSGKMSLADVVKAMNMAATQDLRALVVWPTVFEVLGSAPNASVGRMVVQLDAWYRAGASRLDKDLDGKIDEPGAAIMDAAWPKIADAALSPVLGALTGRLAAVVSRSQDPAGRNGSSFYDGWYGYIDKDLRTLLGKPVHGAYSTRYCGNGDLAACRTALWAALEATYAELAAAQGSDPRTWHADARAERIGFGLLPLTMRWANRSTFQQVITFRAHR
jgi:acyl-homoserine lactone acylase PvdQ